MSTIRSVKWFWACLIQVSISYLGSTLVKIDFEAGSRPKNIVSEVECLITGLL